MKVLSVFSLVIVFHVVVIGLLLIQPGCQSQPTGQPSPSDTAVGPSSGEPAASSSMPVAEFNSALPSTSIERPGFSTPARPVGDTRAEADTSMLTPVLNPVQEDISLPTIEGSYTVKKGDNLTLIAQRQGVSLADLMSANNLSRSSTIYVGQKLVIPAPSGGTVTPVQTTSAPSPGKQVVVARGDTLGKIANRAGTTVQILKSLNGLTSDTIYVGQKLTLPESATVPATVPTSSTPQPTRTPAVTAGAGTYTVQSGDTPSGIAKKFGVTTSALMSVNGISDPRKMRVGQVLQIPSGGSAPVQQARTTTSQPMQPRSEQATTTADPVEPEPTPEDPMSILEALEDEDIPFAEVEVIDGTNQPGN